MKRGARRAVSKDGTKDGTQVDRIRTAKKGLIHVVLCHIRKNRKRAKRRTTRAVLDSFCLSFPPTTQDPSIIHRCFRSAVSLPRSASLQLHATLFPRSSLFAQNYPISKLLPHQNSPGHILGSVNNVRSGPALSLRPKHVTRNNNLLCNQARHVMRNCQSHSRRFVGTATFKPLPPPPTPLRTR